MFTFVQVWWFQGLRISLWGCVRLKVEMWHRKEISEGLFREAFCTASKGAEFVGIGF